MTAAQSPVAPLPPVQILRWYADMGVDIALDDVPHDRFAECASAPQVPGPADAVASSERPRLAMLPARQETAVSAHTPPLATDAGLEAARTLARSAPDLAALRAALLLYDGCALKRTATQLVFAHSQPAARIMLVGEPPDADEDRQGQPFAGSAGRLLDAMLASIGLDRTTAYLANIIPWRPPGNRAPTSSEAALCAIFTARQIELANPDILLCLGGVAAQALLNVQGGILRVRGAWSAYQCGSRQIKAMASLHPAFLLRNPEHKRLAWQDLRALRRMLDTTGAQA